MPSLPLVAADCVARRVLLRGRVQGFGVRPSVYRLAVRNSLRGHVRNTSEGVEVVVEGPPSVVENFLAELPACLPEGAVLEHCTCQPVKLSGYEGFSIIQEAEIGPVETMVPHDLGMCDECQAEIWCKTDRHQRYAFTSCAQCGPRYSLLDSMPYNRNATSMARFPLCPDCTEEYASPDQRRFHAQGIACSKCGPQVWATNSQREVNGSGETAIKYAVDLLRSGKILALKGVGGYQLLCDATSHEAVARLRKQKNRVAKPLAVMVATIESANEIALIDNKELAALRSLENPIVLLRPRDDSILCGEVHPGLAEVGIMLPSTPLHALIARGVGRPLVCTSCNLEGDPLLYREHDAERCLTGICDGWLHHDREIVRPIDDSVVRIVAGRWVTIRLGRGLAPYVLHVQADKPILAVGGHLKSAAAWCNGRQAVLSAHLGDLETIAARERLLTQIDDGRRLYQYEPELVAHDLHPDYYTTQWAETQQISRLAVQHHYAHVVASMLEHQWLDRTVLGVAWDGAGLGTDGTLWGGEFLVSTTRGFGRLARLRPFALPGGDHCAKETLRVAASVLAATIGSEATAIRLSTAASSERWNPLLRLLTMPNATPSTSSAGRLFDAVAFLCLGIDRTQYEGQAAMHLEAIADPSVPGVYRFPVEQSRCNGERILELDWRPLIQDLLNDQRAGAAPGAISMRFHRTLAAGIVRVCQLRQELPVVLCGGVFQNRVLTECVIEQFDQHSQSVGFPGMIPSGDGGLAAGQLAVACARSELVRCV